MRTKEAGSNALRVLVRRRRVVDLDALYEALSYEETRHLPEVVRALADVFAARVQVRQTGQQRRAERAELLAYEFLLRVRGDISQALRPPLVRQLAALLTLDVQRYTSAVPDERRTIEERIHVGELLVEALTDDDGGDVRGAMEKGGATAEEGMLRELRKWVGGPDVEGALNKPPWNVPAGGLPQSAAP